VPAQDFPRHCRHAPAGFPFPTELPLPWRKTSILRDTGVERLLGLITGAEAATVVNNAAATMIALSALAKGREVIVSRGQLIE